MKLQTKVEVLSEKLCALEKLIEERRESDQTALRLQAEMNKTHFEALNHAQARAEARDETYIGREVYDRDQAELRNSNKQIMWYIAIGVGILLAMQFFVRFG